MKKKICMIGMFAFGSIFLVCLFIYFAVAKYYEDKYIINTWFNGVYCTGKTVEEVNKLLKQYDQTNKLMKQMTSGKKFGKFGKLPF